MSAAMRTNDPLLDFIVSQVLSIIYLSEASVSMVKWQSAEDADFKTMILPPAAALYEKAVLTNKGLKMLLGDAKPCVKTTGYSVQVLAQLYSILTPKHHNNVMPCFLNELKSIALLQLQYCLEAIDNNSPLLDHITPVLDGALMLINCCGQELNNKAPKLLAEVNSLYNLLAAHLNINKASTLELASVVRSVSLRNIQYEYRGRDEFLTPIVLEVISRQTKAGLFYNDPHKHAAAALGQQFYILDALLLSYPYVMLENILEETFKIFSSIYNIGYKEALELFSFHRLSIKYSAFDIGAIVSCLNNITRYPTEIPEQLESLAYIKESFVDFILQSYHSEYKEKVSRIIKWYKLTHSSKVNLNSDKKLTANTIFPKRIHLSYPGPIVDWSRRGVVSQRQALFLCSSLLSTVHTDFSNENEENAQAAIEASLPIMDTLKLLFELFDA